MEIETKISQLVNQVLTCEHDKSVPQNTTNQLLSRLNTLNYVLENAGNRSVADVHRKVLDDTLDQVSKYLDAVSKGGTSFKLASILPGSNFSKLQTSITSLLEVSDKIISTLAIQKYIEQGVNSKRKSDIPLNETVNVPDEIKAASMGYKKVKANNGVVNLIPNGETSCINTVASTTTKKNFKNPNAPYHIKLFWSVKLDKCLSHDTRYRSPNMINNEWVYSIRREDFSTLPVEEISRISKEHAIVSRKENDSTSFQITDKSLNGVFYLGNVLLEDFLPFPKRINKDEPYPLRGGDQFGIIMNKESGNKEYLLGFEFEINKL